MGCFDISLLISFVYAVIIFYKMPAIIICLLGGPEFLHDWKRQEPNVLESVKDQQTGA